MMIVVDLVTLGNCHLCARLIGWESRPGEFHPEALAEPDRTLSRHPAPIMEPRYVPTASEQTTLDDDARGSRSSA